MTYSIDDGKTTKSELIGFRFMLLTWLIAAIVGIYAGYAFYRQDSAMNGYLEIVNRPFNCQQALKKKIPDCGESGPFAELSCRYQLNQQCPAVSMLDPDLVAVSNEYAYWISNYELSRNTALIVFLLSSVLFYGVRWGTTGRIKPLWLFKK